MLKVLVAEIERIDFGATDAQGQAGGGQEPTQAWSSRDGQGEGVMLNTPPYSSFRELPMLSNIVLSMSLYETAASRSSLAIREC
jgi:hypothetical protein